MKSMKSFTRAVTVVLVLIFLSEIASGNRVEQKIKLKSSKSSGHIMKNGMGHTAVSAT